MSFFQNNHYLVSNNHNTFFCNEFETGRNCKGNVSFLTIFNVVVMISRAAFYLGATFINDKPEISKYFMQNEKWC